MTKEEDVLNECGHRNSERVEALKKFPSAMCPACLFERIKELEQKNRLLNIVIAEALEECIGDDIEGATTKLEQTLKGE